MTLLPRKHGHRAVYLYDLPVNLFVAAVVILEMTWKCADDVAIARQRQRSRLTVVASRLCRRRCRYARATKWCRSPWRPRAPVPSQCAAMCAHSPCTAQNSLVSSSLQGWYSEYVKTNVSVSVSCEL